LHAWTLTQSNVWGDFLKPLLEKKLTSKTIEIKTLDDTFALAQRQGEERLARHILSVIERLSNEYQKEIQARKQ